MYLFMMCVKRLCLHPYLHYLLLVLGRMMLPLQHSPSFHIAKRATLRKSSAESPWALAGFGQIICPPLEKRKSPSGFQEWRSPDGVWGEVPNSRRQAVKIMHKYFVYTERLAVTTNAQKHFTTFPEGGGKCPSCPCQPGQLSLAIPL